MPAPRNLAGASAEPVDDQRAVDLNLHAGARGERRARTDAHGLALGDRQRLGQHHVLVGVVEVARVDRHHARRPARAGAAAGACAGILPRIDHCRPCHRCPDPPLPAPGPAPLPPPVPPAGPPAPAIGWAPPVPFCAAPGPSSSESEGDEHANPARENTHPATANTVLSDITSPSWTHRSQRLTLEVRASMAKRSRRVSDLGRGEGCLRRRPLAGGAIGLRLLADEIDQVAHARGSRRSGAGPSPLAPRR